MLSAGSACATDYAFAVSAAPTAAFQTRTFQQDQDGGFGAAGQIVNTYIHYSNAISLAIGNLRDYAYVVYFDGQIGKFKVCTACSNQATFVSKVATVPGSAVKRSSLQTLLEAINRLDYMDAANNEVFWQQIYYISVGPTVPIDDVQFVY